MKLATLFATLLVFTNIYAEKNYHFFDPDTNIKKLVISNSAGKIICKQWDKNLLDITITKIQNIKTPYDFSKYLSLIKQKNEVQIKTIVQSSKNNPESLKWEIKIPNYMEYCDISNNGNISIHNNYMKMKVTVNNGNITLKNNKGNIDILDLNGNIFVENFRGFFDVKLLNGNLNINGLYGKGEIEITNGQIISDSLMGKWEIKVHNGNGFIKNSVGNISFNCNNTNMQLFNNNATISGNFITGKLFLFNASKNISLSLVNTSSYVEGKYNNYNIRLSATNGKIIYNKKQYLKKYVDFKKKNGKYLKLSALNGDIEVKSYEK